MWLGACVSSYHYVVLSKCFLHISSCSTPKNHIGGWYTYILPWNFTRFFLGWLYFYSLLIIYESSLNSYPELSIFLPGNFFFFCQIHVYKVEINSFSCIYIFSNVSISSKYVLVTVVSLSVTFLLMLLSN